MTLFLLILFNVQWQLLQTTCASNILLISSHLIDLRFFLFHSRFSMENLWKLYYKIDETFIICHEDFIIKLSPLSDDPIFTCKNDLPWVMSIFLLVRYSARHRSQDICPPISQIVLKNFTKICLIIKECPEEFKV
jgi:hypothetical protein